MHPALDSAIGLPSKSSSASWMLWFLMPAEVRGNLMTPLPAHIVDLLGEPLSRSETARSLPGHALPATAGSRPSQRRRGERQSRILRKDLPSTAPANSAWPGEQPFAPRPYECYYLPDHLFWGAAAARWALW